VKKIILATTVAAQLFAGGDITAPNEVMEPVAGAELHEEHRAEESRYYLVVSGMVLLGDEVRHGEALLDGNDHYGYGFCIDLGYRFGNGFALEYDFTYGRNDTREITDTETRKATAKYYTSALDIVYTYEATEQLGIFGKVGYEYEIEKINASFFEVTVAMAFDYFAQEQVDVAIIETGLGGRLDSTNIITPILSIITNISLDHQAMLGDTLPQIAKEKAGIIKKGIPVIIGEFQAETFPIFSRKAEEMNAPLFLAEKLTKLHIDQNNIQGIKGSFSYQDSIIRFQTDISGPFQEKNLATAITAYQYLLESKFLSKGYNEATFVHIRTRTHFIGRWTILGQKPLILADSAHNIAGLTLLAQAIQDIPHQKMYIILGTVNDKDPSYLFDILPKGAFYHFAKANIPRGLDANELLQKAQKKGINGQAYSSVRRAFAAAKRKAQPNDLIVIAAADLISNLSAALNDMIPEAVAKPISISAEIAILPLAPI